MTQTLPSQKTILENMTVKKTYSFKKYHPNDSEEGSLFVVEVETLLAGDESRPWFQPKPLAGDQFSAKKVLFSACYVRNSLAVFG